MRYWKRLNADKSINTVESYSHPLDIKGAIEIDEKEYNDYLVSLPPPQPEPAPRDLLAELTAQKDEIDELRARLNKAGVA